MSANQHEIQHINDLLALSHEELVRFIPDLLAWHELMQDLQTLGAKSVGMTWVDDGRPAEVFSAEMRIKETGEIVVIKGPAWEGE